MSGGRWVKGLVRAHKRSAEPRPLDAPGGGSPFFSMLWPLCRKYGAGAEPGRAPLPPSPPFRLVYSAREMVARRASWNGSRMSTVIPADRGAT